MLYSQDLPTKELSRVVAILRGDDPGDLPEALGPLYRLDDGADMIAGLPTFDERGLLLAEGSGPVEVSSDDTSGEGGSEKTIDHCPTSTPLPSQAILLRELADDDVAGEVSAGVSSCPTRTSRGPASTLRATRDIVSPRAKRKKKSIQPKATPDAPSALSNASPLADGEGEACAATCQALIIAPSEPPKHPEAVVVAPLPKGRAL
ncbi:hypothetical protein D1007_17731 [Hordeum vulgare]|nr:hypothetical protein D1007_17731 [Hordeum vulgare]